MQIVTRGPTAKNVFKEVARLRSRESGVLFREREQLGAVYLLGYSVECYLKYAVCERQDWDRLPDAVKLTPASNPKGLYTHDWALLVEVAGIPSSIERQRDMHTRYLSLCDQWGPDLRYRTKQFPNAEGELLYKDLVQLYNFLRELVP